ncbi:hypothetical protein Q9966_004292 [Columba livia]|nr:hypothetical protein Q9966_004292 [Columba livia]
MKFLNLSCYNPEYCTDITQDLHKTSDLNEEQARHHQVSAIMSYKITFRWNMLPPSCSKIPEPEAPVTEDPCAVDLDESGQNIDFSKGTATVHAAETKGEGFNLFNSALVSVHDANRQNRRTAYPELPFMSLDVLGGGGEKRPCRPYPGTDEIAAVHGHASPKFYEVPSTLDFQLQQATKDVLFNILRLYVTGDEVRIGRVNWIFNFKWKESHRRTQQSTADMYRSYTESCKNTIAHGPPKQLSAVVLFPPSSPDLRHINILQIISMSGNTEDECRSGFSISPIINLATIAKQKSIYSTE